MASKRTIEAIRDLYAAGTDDESTLTALVSMLASLRAAGDEDDILLVAEEAALRATVIGQFEIASQLWAELCALRPGDALTRFILARSNGASPPPIRGQPPLSAISRGATLVASRTGALP